MGTSGEAQTTVSEKNPEKNCFLEKFLKEVLQESLKKSPIEPLQKSLNQFLHETASLLFLTSAGIAFLKETLGEYPEKPVNCLQEESLEKFLEKLSKKSQENFLTECLKQTLEEFMCNLQRNAWTRIYFDT